VYVCNVFLLLVENDAQQTPLSLVEEEEQFVDCLELVSCLIRSLPITSEKELVHSETRYYLR